MHTAIGIAMANGVPGKMSPANRLASDPKPNCDTPKSANATPALFGNKSIRPVVQFAPSMLDGPTVRKRPSMMAGNPPQDKSVTKRSEEHTSELQSRGHLACRL